MPAIPDRGEGNARRKDRLAKQRKGPGWFVYNGKGVAVEETPTILINGRDVPVYDANGMPVIQNGRQLFERKGSPVLGPNGIPMMGGTPKRTLRPIDPFVLWGVSFPSGVPVRVEDHGLALKLRGMGTFDEVEAAPEEKPTPQPQPEPVAEQAAQPMTPAQVEVEQPKRRGRPPKAKE